VRVPYIDLQSQYAQIKSAVNRKINALMKRGDFILGQDVVEFEQSFTKFLNVRYGLGVNSGTDALFLGLLSLGVKPGDEVIVPAFTYIASAFAVSYIGAKPVFVDIDETTFNIDSKKIEKAITNKTRAIMSVHLYGQSADMGPISDLAKKYSLKIIEDAAQAHGAEYQMTDDRGQRTERKKTGSIGDIGAFSFYPTKNLGAFGDAGMVVTNDAALFEKLKKLRDYGRKSRYEHTSLGYNSRLDAIQAIFLSEKLKKIESWNKKRIQAAATYRKLLKGVPGILLPGEAGYGKHIYHIFAVRVKNRDKILKELRKSGINAGLHYSVPLHLQEVYRFLGYKNGDFPVAEAIAQDVLCLPIYPHIKDKEIKYVVSQLKGLITHG
jgi:dTDP-4-amino-4,6-dideoxygalactose transaminase